MPEKVVQRFLHVDPVIKPWESPYATFNNNPISIIDPKGLDGEPYKVKKGDNLTKIAKRFHTTVSDLKKLNGIKNADKINVGQQLIVGSQPTPKEAQMLGMPEGDFSSNPLTGYNNPNKSNYITNEQATVKSLGTYFISNHYGKVTQENTMVVGGPLLNEIKKLPSVQNLIRKGATQLFSDGRFTAGEYFTAKFRMGDLNSPDGDRMKTQVIEDLINGKKFTDSRFFSAEFWLGSYDFSMRVAGDGKTMVITVYDSKTIESATDRKGFLQKILPLPDKVTPTYQRYIWFKPIK